MTTVFRKELRAYFTRRFGFLLSALILFCGLGAMTVFNLSAGSGSLSSTDTALSLLLLLLAPLLTMYAFPDERRSGSDALLFSLPLSTTSIVLGKFFAVLALPALSLCVPILVSLAFSAWGSIHALSTLLVWLGYFLLCAVSLSLCLFLSTFASRPRNAFLLSLGGMAVLYLLANVGIFLPNAVWVSLLLCLVIAAGFAALLWAVSKSLSLCLTGGGALAAAAVLGAILCKERFPALLAALFSLGNPFLRSAGFSYGSLDCAAVLFELSLTAILLYLTVHRINHRRLLTHSDESAAQRNAFLGKTAKSAHGSKGVLIAASLLICALLLNTALAALPAKITKPSLVKNEAFALSGVAEDELAALSEPVTLFFVISGGAPFADGELYGFLQTYASASPQLTLKIVDSLREKDFLAAHGLEEEADGYIVVESKHRYRVLSNEDLYYYANTEFGFSRMSVSEYLLQCSYIEESGYGTEYLYQFVETTEAFFDGQAILANALHFVTAPSVPTIYLLSEGDSSALDTSLAFSLEQAGACIKILESGAQIPDDCTLLVLNAPTKDISAQSAAGLSSYLAAGGKLLLTTSYTAGVLPNLQSVLLSYGLSYGEDKMLICEGSASYAYSSSLPHLFFAHIATHPASQGFTEKLFLPLAHDIKMIATEGVTLTPWLYTSEKGYLMPTDKRNDPSTFTPSEFATRHAGVIAEAGESKIVWISSPDAISTTGDAFSDGGNLTLAKRAVLWLTGSEDSASAIAAKPFAGQIISPSGGMIITGLLCAFCLPGAVLVAGWIILYRRKKR